MSRMKKVTVLGGVGRRQKRGGLSLSDKKAEK